MNIVEEDLSLFDVFFLTVHSDFTSCHNSLLKRICVFTMTFRSHQWADAEVLDKQSYGYDTALLLVVMCFRNIRLTIGNIWENSFLGAEA